MYSELLDKTKSLSEVQYVLDNLSEETKEELHLLFGNDYKQRTFEIIIKTEIYIIRLKENNKPVGVYGLVPVNDNDKYSKGIYLLPTNSLHEGNIITFLKGAKKQVLAWARQYGLIMDNLYKENKTIQKWLKLLGFLPSPYQNDIFQLYYIGDLSQYE